MIKISGGFYVYSRINLGIGKAVAIFSKLTCLICKQYVNQNLKKNPMALYQSYLSCEILRGGPRLRGLGPSRELATGYYCQRLFYKSNRIAIVYFIGYFGIIILLFYQ